MTLITVGLPVAAANFLAELAQTESLGKAPARRVLALQSVPTRQVVLAAARLSFALSAYQAAVTVVRHVAAGAARAQTCTHIASNWTCGFRLSSSELPKIQEHNCTQEDLHFFTGRFGADTN